MSMLRKNTFRSLGVILALALLVMIPTYIAVSSAKGKEDCGDSYKTESNLLADPIWTESGYVSGTLFDNLLVTNVPYGPPSSVRVGYIGEAVRIYKGIPYAAPPVGNLRFKPPEPVTPWSGIRDSTTFSKWPPQNFPTGARLGYLMDDAMSEDCLYLNVITPAKRKNERLPVMVWLHGGGLTSQSGTRAGYNMPVQAQRGVVSVSVSGRLDVMGFLAHPLLSAESPHGASGNYGMLDLVAALKWVKKNIAAFGGDPHHIMIWGQSGGGSKVNWLMTSPLTTGLFSAAVCQSGGGGGRTLADQESRGVALFTQLGISTLAELRALPWQDIQDAARAIGYSTSPTIDGWSMIDTVQNVFATGKQQNVPFMIGTAHTEWTPTNFTVNLMPTLKSSGSPTYVFVHTHVPPGWKPAKAWHSLENGYIFGAVRAVAPNNFIDFAIAAGAPYTRDDSVVLGLKDAGWTYGRTLRYPSCGPEEFKGLVTTDPMWNWQDAWHEDFMFETWAQFAATGDPNLPRHALSGPRLPKWLPYDPAVDTFMALDVTPVVEPGYSTPTVGGVLPIPIPFYTTPFPGYSGPPPF